MFLIFSALFLLVPPSSWKLSLLSACSCSLTKQAFGCIALSRHCCLVVSPGPTGPNHNPESNGARALTRPCENVGHEMPLQAKTPSLHLNLALTLYRSLPTIKLHLPHLALSRRNFCLRRYA